MMPTTPSGCGISRFLAGMNCSAVEIRCGAIHFFRCLAACLISPSTSSVSAIAVSVGQRWPKSAEIACSKRDSLSEIAAFSRASRSSRSASVGAGRGPGQLEDPMKGVLQGALPRAFHWLVHGGSLLGDVSGPPRLGFCTHSGKSGLVVRNGTPAPRFGLSLNPEKIAPRAFPKRACVGTYRSHPGAWPGLPSQEASGRDRSAPPGVGRLRSGIGFAKARKGLSRGGAAR